MSNHYKEHLAGFLNHNFHSEMKAVPFVIQEYVEKSNQETVGKTIQAIESFLNSDLTEKEKTKFIEDQIEISFTRFSASPVDWLEGVLAILLLIK